MSRELPKQVQKERIEFLSFETAVSLERTY
jgi:hypothetical protein